MEADNRVIQLCIAGTQAEFRHNVAEAMTLYEQAWEIQTNAYEACIAAHYMARHQKDPKEELNWNQKALEFAGACGDDRVLPFLPSLYLNIGKSHEKLGDLDTAQKYFEQAAQLGLSHQMDLE